MRSSAGQTGRTKPAIPPEVIAYEAGKASGERFSAGYKRGGLGEAIRSLLNVNAPRK